MAHIGRVQANIERLGITLPTPFAPVANYVPYVLSGSHLYLSGQLPIQLDGSLSIGQLGATMSVDDGREAARSCALNLVSEVKAALGDLDRVKKFVKLNVYINSAPSFTQHALVANGASDLIVSIFGDEVGKHARCAVGMAQLPAGAAVEIDSVVEVREAGEE